MNGIMGKLGGRKFLVALFGLIAVVLLAAFNIDIKPYENAIVGVLGTYLLGQGVADGLSGGKTSSTPPSNGDVG